MMTLARINHPFSPVFDSLFHDIFEGRQEIKKHKGYNFSSPKVNIVEKPDSFQIELAAPGMKKEDFELKVEKDELWIKASREESAEKAEGKYTKREFSYGVFERKFILPDTLDKEAIEANYVEGILTLTLPKREDQVALSRQIEVQ